MIPTVLDQQHFVEQQTRTQSSKTLTTGAENRPSSDDLRSRFLQLSLVNILSNLMVPLAGLVDAAFLGHLSEIRYLAGVALAGILFNFVYRAFKLLRLGTTAPTAQAAGRSEPDTVLLVLLRNGCIALAIGLIVLLLQYPLRELGFTLLSAAPDVKSAGIEYYNGRIWGAPAVLLNFVLIGWFMGLEHNKAVLILSAVGNGSNVLLDYLFIVCWGWQSAGAGIATAASQYLMLLVGFIFILKDSWLTSVPRIMERIFDPNALKDTFKFNGDLFLARISLVLTCSLFTDVASTLGTLILAANTLLIEMVYLAANFMDGLSFTTVSLAGSFRGARSNERLVPLLRLSGGVSLGTGLVFALAFILFTDPLFGLLTNHQEVIEQIHHYLLWLIPLLSCWSIALMLHGYFLGLTEGAIVRNSMIYALILGFIPVAILAWKFHQDQFLWLALLSFIVIRTVILSVQVPDSLREQT